MDGNDGFVLYSAVSPSCIKHTFPALPCALPLSFFFSSVCQWRTEREAEMEPFELGNTLVKCRQSFLLLLLLLPPFSIARHFSHMFFFFLEGTIEDYIFFKKKKERKRVLI